MSRYRLSFKRRIVLGVEGTSVSGETGHYPQKGSTPGADSGPALAS